MLILTSLYYIVLTTDWCNSMYRVRLHGLVKIHGYLGFKVSLVSQLGFLVSLVSWLHLSQGCHSFTGFADFMVSSCFRGCHGFTGFVGVVVSLVSRVS